MATRVDVIMKDHLAVLQMIDSKVRKTVLSEIAHILINPRIHNGMRLTEIVDTIKRETAEDMIGIKTDVVAVTIGTEKRIDTNEKEKQNMIRTGNSSTIKTETLNTKKNEPINMKRRRMSDILVQRINIIQVNY